MLEVKLNTTNFKEYFDMVPIKDDDGKTIFLVKSKLFDDGWYLWDVKNARDTTVIISGAGRAMPIPLTTTENNNRPRIRNGLTVVFVSKTVTRNRRFELFEDHAHYNIELLDGEVNDFDYYGGKIVKNYSETYSQPNLNYKAYKDYPF